jgi:hypothetical protein
MTKITIYKKEDYTGEFNLLRNERRLILRAFKRANGDLGMMAKLLETTEKPLLLMIVSHNLANDFIAHMPDEQPSSLGDLPLFS